MDLKQLTYFVRIAELGSISKAGAALGVAQPALSRQLRALEVELKANLFSRNGRGVLLTDAGRRFLDHARGVLQGVDSARLSVRTEMSGEGRVVVGLPPSVGKVLTLALVSRFVGRFPKASLGVVDGLSGGLLEQLVSGRLDVAVLLNPAASQRVAIDPVTTEDLYLIGSKPLGRRGARVRFGDIVSLPLIFPSAPHPIRSLVESEAARLGLRLNIALEIDVVGSIVDLVAAGYGYSIVPKNVMRIPGDAKSIAWHRIDATGLTTTLCIATATRRPLSSLARETALMLRDVMREVLTGEAGEATPSRNS